MSLTISKTKNGYIITRNDQSKGAYLYSDMRVVEGFETFKLAEELERSFKDSSKCSACD